MRKELGLPQRHRDHRENEGYWSCKCSSARREVLRRRLNYRAKLFNSDSRVTQDSTQGTERYFGMQRNRNRLSLGIVRMTESNVATLLANRLITKFAESPDQFFARNNRHLWGHRVTTTLPI